MIRFCDSFGHYTTAAEACIKWGQSETNPTPYLAGGRNNGPYLNCGGGSNALGRLLNFTAGQTLWIAGVASLGASQVILQSNVYGGIFYRGQFTDGESFGSTAAQYGINAYTLAITGSGAMVLTVWGWYQDGGGAWHEATNSGSPAFVSSPVFQYQSAPLNPSLWYYFEVKAVVHATTAAVSIEVRVNGTVVFPLTAILSGGFPLVWPQLETFAPVLNSSTNSDFVVLDDTGANNTNYLGDVRVIAQLPASDGYYQDWTPLTGSAHFSEVNAGAPPGDSEYVSASTPGNTDSYGFSAPPTAAQVFGVQVNLWARKSDAGGRSIEALARLASTDLLSAPQPISTGYGDFMSVFEVDPSGAAWTDTSLAAAQFGVKLSA